MKLDPRLEEYRFRGGHWRSNTGEPFGIFEMPGPCGERLTIMATDGYDTDWEHVSVSARRRIPNWIEMCFVKDLFWSPEECVVQFHPPRSKHVNNHSRCLHLWRYKPQEFVTPPEWMIGDKSLGTLDEKEKTHGDQRRTADTADTADTAAEVHAAPRRDD